MNIKAVKIYQAVEFCRKLETYFVETSTRMKGLQISVYKEDGVAIGVRLRTELDDIVVPFTNVAFMKVELSDADKKTKGREPKFGAGSPYRSE